MIMQSEGSTPLIVGDQIVKEYTVGSRTVRVLDGLSFRAMRGEYISIIGPSGSGKTTLFNLIGGLDRVTSGIISIEGRDISQLDAGESAQFRCRKIGFIFQTFNLLLHLTALENVMLPMVFADMTVRAAEAKARTILERVGLGDRLRNLGRELSGGQQQRVAIARAFANDPSIILADEPTGNLDLQTGQSIIGLLREMNRERQVTVLTGTHDASMLEISDRILRLVDGRLEVAGASGKRAILS